MALGKDLGSLCVSTSTHHLIPEIKFYGRAWRDRKGICQAWYDSLMNDFMGLPS